MPLRKRTVNPAKATIATAIRASDHDLLVILAKRLKMSQVDFVSYMICSLANLSDDAIYEVLRKGRFASLIHELSGHYNTESFELTGKQLSRIREAMSKLTDSKRGKDN